MKVPSYRRLNKSDFADEFKDLVDRLGNSINSGIDVLYEALNKKITLSDNIACTVKDVDVEIDSKGQLKNKTQVKLDAKGQVIGITVINGYCTKDSSVLPVSGIFVNYIQSGDSIKIQNIVGLPVDRPFRITLVIYI